MSSTLGEKLRQAREERGISLSEVSEQTRISPLYLKAIEADDYKTLPGGIFNKGFVRSYARYIGFDEQEALHEYAQLTTPSDAPTHDEPRAYRPEVLTDDRSSSSLPTILIAGVILAVITVGGLLAVRYLLSPSDDRATSTQSGPTPAQESPPVNTAPSPAAVGDGIMVQLKAISEPVWMSYAVDGTAAIKTLAPDEEMSLQARERFSLSYSKAKLPNLQIRVNGQPFTPKTEASKGKVEIDLTKENVASLLSGGTASGPSQMTTPAAAPPPSAAGESRGVESSNASAANTSQPAPTPKRAATPRPTPKPTQAPPKATPTPIIVGRPPAPN